MYEFDIHGFTPIDAKKAIEQLIVRLDKSEKQLKIIHGYHGGDALSKLVRDPHAIRSKRIFTRRRTMNQGETIIILD